MSSFKDLLKGFNDEVKIIIIEDIITELEEGNNLKKSIEFIAEHHKNDYIRQKLFSTIQKNITVDLNTESKVENSIIDRLKKEDFISGFEYALLKTSKDSIKDIFNNILKFKKQNKNFIGQFFIATIFSLLFFVGGSTLLFYVKNSVYDGIFEKTLSMATARGKEHLVSYSPIMNIAELLFYLSLASIVVYILYFIFICIKIKHILYIDIFHFMSDTMRFQYLNFF